MLFRLHKSLENRIRNLDQKSDELLKEQVILANRYYLFGKQSDFERMKEIEDHMKRVRFEISNILEIAMADAAPKKIISVRDVRFKSAVISTKN